MDKSANTAETAETPEESQTARAENTELEEDDAIYPEGYDPESEEDFFPPEAPPLPELPAPDGQPQAAGTPGEPAPESKPGAPDAAFKAELDTLDHVYPEAVKNGIPEAVLREYQSGAPLLNAYAAYRAKTDADTIAALRAENAALKQAAANRDRAVVRGVTGGSPVNEPDDPFLRGMREYW